MALTVTASPVSAYQDEDIAWLWPGRIPSGMVTILEGDPGQGKSTLTLDLAARLSTGRPMPGEHGSREPKATLLLSAEDSASVTIRRRLRAAGADLDRVHVLDETTTADGRERLIELPGDLPAIEQTIHRLGATLVVVDPLTAFLADTTNANSDHWVRRTLWPVKVAQRTGATVLVVRHLTKTGGTKAIYRGGGAIDLAGAARAVYLIGADPADEDRKIFAPVKLNIAAPPPTLSYRLEEDPEHQCARVIWSTEPVALTAADLLAGPSAPRGRPARQRQAAEDLLRNLLADGPMPVSWIQQEALAAGIGWRTVETAKTNLYVVSERGRDERGHLRPATWRLPTPPHRNNSSPQAYGLAVNRPGIS